VDPAPMPLAARCRLTGRVPVRDTGDRGGTAVPSRVGKAPPEAVTPSGPAAGLYCS